MQAATQAHKVLIVEDETLIAEDISDRLQSLGHEVIHRASTADAAVEMAPQADVILMDIRLEGTRDGIDAACEIRQKYLLPVIFLTAHADQSTRDRARQASPSGYLVKPLQTASLQTAIEVAIAKHLLELDLRKQLAWHRSILTSLPDATVTTASDGSIHSLNPAAERITGWTNAEALGLPCAQVVRMVVENTTASEGMPKIVEPAELAVLWNAPIEFDPRWRLLDRSCRELMVEGSAAPLRDRHSVLGAVLTFRNVTLRRWREQQIHQARRMQTAARLAVMVAQEYSGLLTVIQERAELLLAQLGEFSQVARTLEEIRSACAAAAGISQRLDGFGSRPSKPMQAFTVNSLLRRMGRLILLTAGERINVSVQAEPGLGRVRADSDLLGQAILNLVVHACTSMQGHGELGLKTSRPGLETSAMDLPLSAETPHWVLLAVTYSAKEELLDHLFEPVVSQDDSLALPLAHAIVCGHGGFLTAQSTQDGGTRLELLLPCVSEDVAKGASTATAPSVLLVEGREFIQAHLHKVFESAGYNLLEAADVGEAVLLGQVCDGSLDLLIAEDAISEEIALALRPQHTSLAVLRIVDRLEESPDEIRRPFSQGALLEKAAQLLNP